MRETLDRPLAALIEAEQSLGDAALFREMISVFVRRPGARELRAGDHLLGVDAEPAERRADLRALFSLYVSNAPRSARR